MQIFMEYFYSLQFLGRELVVVQRMADHTSRAHGAFFWLHSHMMSNKHLNLVASLKRSLPLFFFWFFFC